MNNYIHTGLCMADYVLCAMDQISSSNIICKQQDEPCMMQRVCRTMKQAR